MVGAYTSLPPAVAATVPRRTVLRDSWIRHQPSTSSEATDVGETTSATSSPASTPPMTPRSPRPSKLGELRQKWDSPRPMSVVLTTYSPPGDTEKQELQGVTGKVSKAKAFFESAPLHQSSEKEASSALGLRKNESFATADTIVSYRVRNPLRMESPKPKPRRLRNTISTFPRWVSEDDPVSKEDSRDSSDQVVVTSDISSSTSEGRNTPTKMEVDKMPQVEITRIKPSFVRRRYGTVTGLITDRSNIEEALRNKLSAEHSVYSKVTSEGSLQHSWDGDHVASSAAAAGGGGGGRGEGDAFIEFGDRNSLSGSSSLISIREGEDEIHQARRVAVLSAADGKNTATTSGNWEAVAASADYGEEEEPEEEEEESPPAAPPTTTVSRVRDGAWNRRVTASSHNPLPSCRCDHATSSLDDHPHIITRVNHCSNSISTRSECQGSAAEGHVSLSYPTASSETMIVLPEDGQVQAAPAPRVVAACIKSYHDIPEELFNSLQESSVDPQPSPSPPPPPPPPSSPPTPLRNHNALLLQHAAPSPPTPAPRSDWKTMREGRKALLMGEVSDADTEEGSEADLGGVASTSDYHTSDGRGSSLSGASDDHHKHDNNHQHQKNTEFGFYNDNQHQYYSSNAKDADEEAEFEIYNPQGSTSAVLIRNNFRGFCSTMLGSQTMPSSTEYVLPPSRPPPPTRFSTRSRSPTPSRNDQRPSSSASLLEEELRAAGVYFRRPGSPPRIPSRSRTLSPPPRPPSSLKLERNSMRDAEAVAAALHVLDASLAGLSDSSGESSPARSHSSTVVELRQQQQQYAFDPAAVDTQQTPRSSSASSSSVVCHSTSALTLEGTTTATCDYNNPSSSSSQPDLCDTTDSASFPPSVIIYNSDLNDSDNSSAVDFNNTYEPGLNNPDDRTSFPGVEGLAQCYGTSLKRGGIVRGGFGRASSNVGGTGEDGGPYQSPHHHHHQQSHPHCQQPKDPSAMENFNLIEEVYVDTRPVPRSTVSMRAYYPGVHYDSPSSSPTPKSCLKPPPPPPPPASTSTSSNSSPSRHPERGASLDSTQTVPADSDSGHESGATSPCGTLILDDTQSPPPSPPNNHTLKTHSTSIHTHAPSLSHSRTSSLHSCRGPGVLEGEVGVAVVGDPTHVDVGMGRMALDPRPPTHFVVVAIDFGTTYSGYAFSFTRDPDSIHMMKKWEGGDPGVQNQKTPTIVLLTPEEEFHSLGFIARDTYHDLDPKDAKKWLYFDKFKMALHADQTLSRDTLLEAANGRRIPALKIFSYALQYFRDHALKELSDQAGVEVLEEDVRWVITVPAIWSHPAKQFMRTAAYQAGMGSSARPEQLLIALEPEAAAIYCRRLRRHQLLPERPPELRPPRHSTLKEATPPPDSTSVPALPELDREELVSLPYRSVETVADWLTGDTVYAVVDCGGGTVDITVHQMTDKSTGHLKELHKATGGPHGSTGVDEEFERLLETIFGADFLQTFRQQRPAAYVDLMIAFESRKRNASPYRSNPLNIALPFSFIDLYRKFRGKDVEWAMKKHQNLGVKWSAQGMLRVEQETMRQLFLPTLTSITQAIEAVLSAPEVGRLQYMFLVGGFAESELLQKHIRDIFGHRVNVIIPQGMGLAILRGAVQFGLDPGVVTVRRSRLTYGVGVLNRYQPGLHPSDKRVVAAGSEWCADVLDRFVAVDESVAVGDVVVRPYTPATPGQSTVILHLYATHRHDAKFVTEDGVQRVGTLHLELGPPIQDSSGSPRSGRREITVHMKFGDTEVKASAVDHLTGQVVRANIDFLAL